MVVGGTADDSETLRSPTSAAGAVHALSRATGETYTLRGRLAGGETGAHEIVRENGERCVLKWERDPDSQAGRRRGIEATEQLRLEAGWPVPRQTAVEANGWLFVVQEFMAGSPIRLITDGLVDELLALHDRRLAMAPSDDDGAWARTMIRTLTIGGNGYCLHESLRNHDARTARLVERIEEIGRSLDPKDLPGSDVIHHDLHPGNILQSSGRLSAIIDTDFAQTGDARFDLVTLALASCTIRCDPGGRDRLMDAAFGDLTEPRRRAYVGHLVLRAIDWPIRRGRADEIDLWLALAERFLPDGREYVLRRG